MGFIGKAAKAGLFGLAGLAASGGGKKKSDPLPKPSASLMTEGFSSNMTPPSLVNRKQIY